MISQKLIYMSHPTGHMLEYIQLVDQESQDFLTFWFFHVICHFMGHQLSQMGSGTYTPGVGLHSEMLFDAKFLTLYG